jgi:Tol biopolymer transport system component
VYECDNDLCLMTIDDETQKRLVDVSEQIPGMMSANAPAFSSDGQRIVFTGSFPNAIELFVVSIDGTGLKQISDGVYSHHASYSPDGTQIVFKCEGSKTVPSQICLMNADGAEKRLLTDTDLTFWEPKFTPDGQHIVVSAYKDSFVLGLFGHTDPSRLYVMNTDGSDFRQLVSGEETFAVAFSTDGQEAVYQTYDKDTGKSEGIYVINIDGSNRRRLGDDWWDIARRGGGLAE